MPLPNLRILKLEWPRKLLLIAALAFILRYMWWRLSTFNPDAPVFSVTLYCAEAFGVLTLLLHAFMTYRLSEREPPEPEEGLSVDVFIPTINEPLSVVRRTALCARAMDYPHATWILDDGRRPEVRALAEELGCGYIARDNNDHAKAGNLNYALEHTNGEFIAIFDADHAPAKRFLTRTLGYFRDMKVAFVQTPQDFYNLDSYQHRAKIRQGKLWTEQSLFFRVVQRGKDTWNAAFFCGSCAIVRRSALVEAGGFATGTVTEDIHTSIRLHKLGYASVYHAESLAFGIAAAQIEPFLRQRIRWGQGAMQVWRKEGLWFSPRLTLAQKINYSASILTYFEGWQRLIYYITPPIVLLTGTAPLVSDADHFLRYFVPYIFFTLWIASELGRGYARVLIIEQYNMARFAAFAYATLGLLRGNLRFRVTNKRLTGAALYSLWLWPQYLVFTLNLVAVMVGSVYYLYFAYLSNFAYSASTLWACVNTGFAFAVLSFTLGRMHHKRLDYRFSIPLVASVKGTDGHSIEAAVHDLSSAGMQLLMQEDPGVAIEQELRGHLRLPGQLMPFRAQVRTAEDQRIKPLHSIGCQFLWESHAARQKLELFLYGSDLEWQVHHISERSPTLLERCLRPLVHWQELDERPPGDNDYDYRQPLLYRPEGAETDVPEPGMFALNGAAGMGMAMVFTPFTPGSRFEGKVFGTNGWERVTGRVVEEKGIEKPGKTMYFYRIQGELGNGPY